MSGYRRAAADGLYCMHPATEVIQGDDAVLDLQRPQQPGNG